MAMTPVARTVHGNHVWRDNSGEGPIIYVSGMSVDADGSPHSYHPENGGLDSLDNARDGDKWVGIVTRDGVPVVQGKGDPAPGYYVSQTSLSDTTVTDHGNPHRYVDSETVPFVAFSGRLYGRPGTNTVLSRLDLGVNLGDYAIVFDMKTGKSCGAFFADVGPSFKLGEASIKVAKELGINPNPRWGGVDRSLRIAYMIFPTSFTRWQAQPWPQTPEQVVERALSLFEEWGAADGGGLTCLKSTLLDIQTRSASFGSEHLDPTIDVPLPGERFRDPELHYREEPKDILGH